MGGYISDVTPRLEMPLPIPKSRCGGGKSILRMFFCKSTVQLLQRDGIDKISLLYLVLASLTYHSVRLSTTWLMQEGTMQAHGLTYLAMDTGDV